MNKNDMCILRGIGIILAVGATIGFLVCKVMHKKKTFQKKTNKALKALSYLLTSAHYIFK